MVKRWDHRNRGIFIPRRAYLGYVIDWNIYGCYISKRGRVYLFNYSDAGVGFIGTRQTTINYKAYCSSGSRKIMRIKKEKGK